MAAQVRREELAPILTGWERKTDRKKDRERLKVAMEPLKMSIIAVV